MNPDGATARALDLIAQFPGEYSDRQIRYGRVVVADVPDVGESPLPSRWVERCREAGLLRPARVRAMPSARCPRVGQRTGERWMELEGQAFEVMLQLVTVREVGIGVGDLARLIVGSEDPSGSMERTLIELYREGYASPPGALWRLL